MEVKLQPADWQVWAQVPELELWELIALSMDKEPRPRILFDSIAKVGEAAPAGSVEATFFLRMRQADACSQGGGGFGSSMRAPMRSFV